MAIPALPGAPNLLRTPPALAQAFNALNTASLLVADAGIVKGLFNEPQWGVFKEGSAVASADSVLTFDYRQDTRILDYPVQAGSFESYNKIGTPYDARVQLTKGGTEADRAAFLTAIEAAVTSLDLFDVVTPERVYKSANLQRFDYRRSAQNGMGLITVDLWLVEIRVTVAADFTSSKKPAGSPLLNRGTVQGATIQSSVKFNVSSGLTKLGVVSSAVKLGG